MASKPKQTSQPVAKVASKQLKNPTTPKAAKTTAASALSQAPTKAKKK
jgi:hypothetical protein